jgi:translation initiation factor 1
MNDHASRPVVYSTGIGRIRYCPRCGQLESSCQCRGRTATERADAGAAPPRDGFVRIGRERQGRHGKTMTLVWGLPDDDTVLAALAQALKKLCGSGGTFKPVGRVEIQGDHRDKVAAKLEALGYRIKRVGG